MHQNLQKNGNVLLVEAERPTALFPFDGVLAFGGGSDGGYFVKVPESMS